jgi:SAM-dependent methyltransferase
MSFKTFAAAVELDVFTRLANGRTVTVTEFAGEFGLAHRPADVLLAACASLGLLDKTGDRYRNSPLAEKFLVAGRPHYFGGFVRFYDQLYPGWHNVVDALRTNRPVMWDAGERDTPFSADDSMMMETFWEAMHSLAGSTALALAEVYDFGQHRRLLDVGGGSGGFPIELCGRFPDLSATVYELPHVCPIATEKVKAAGLDGRIDTAAGDYHADLTLPGGYDVILLSQILHCEGEPAGRALLAKCFAALPPGGVLLVCELLLNEDRTGPRAAALMGMNMLVGQLEGRNYAETEYLSWLADTGFTEPEIVRFEAAGANGAVVARKGAA